MYLVPGQTEPDTVAEVCHRADQDGYPPLAPEVTLAEQDVGATMPAVQADQPLNLPDGTVRGVRCRADQPDGSKQKLSMIS